jgi:hypothetical protein
MTKREKIIVGVMCLTIVFGAYELLGTRGAKKAAPLPQANPTEELRKFVTDMTQKMVGDRMGNEYQQMVSQVAVEWTKDPFINSIAPIASKSSDPAVSKQPADKATPSPSFVLSGFLQMGKTKLAIINGMEYAVGDAIDTSGHYLQSISTENIVIGRTNGVEKIQLPLSEID